MGKGKLLEPVSMKLAALQFLVTMQMKHVKKCLKQEQFNNSFPPKKPPRNNLIHIHLV